MTPEIYDFVFIMAVLCLAASAIGFIAIIIIRMIESRHMPRIRAVDRKLEEYNQTVDRR